MQIDFGNATANEIARQWRADEAAHARTVTVAPEPTPASVPAGRTPLPCVNIGDPLPPHPNHPLQKWHNCDHPSQPLGMIHVCSCKGCGPGCGGYAISSPDRVTRVSSGGLVAVDDGRQFNCSIIEFQGKRLLAYRAGWFSPRVHVAELGDDLQPLSTTPISLPHPKCNGGQEDPRLFVFGGKLHLAFAGLTFAGGRLHSVSVMLARLTDDLKAERIWEPRYPKRTPVEKNWMPWEHDGQLYVTYSYAPHRVLRIDVERGTAEDAFETSTPLPWSGGSIRGGAPPVRVGDELIHWFHGWKRETKREYYRYSVGVLATEAKPPFRVTRVTPGPVWQPDTKLNNLNVTRDKEVIYPCGAILDRGRWLVSAGHQDTLCEIAEFDASEIDRLMVKV